MPPIVSPVKTPETFTATSPATYKAALWVVTTLFFMWGFLTCLNDVLVPHLKSIFDHDGHDQHARLSPWSKGRSRIASGFITPSYFRSSAISTLCTTRSGAPSQPWRADTRER